MYLTILLVLLVAITKVVFHTINDTTSDTSNTSDTISNRVPIEETWMIYVNQHIATSLNIDNYHGDLSSFVDFVFRRMVKVYHWCSITKETC